MGKLHEVLAVEDSLGKVARKACDDAVKAFKGQETLFKGHLIETVPLKEDADDDLTLAVVAGGSETLLVSETVHTRLASVLAKWANHIDATAQKERANTTANADVIVNGETLLTGIPATTLLTLEARLNELRTVLMAVPCRDPAKVWEASEFNDVVQTMPEIRILTHKMEQSEVTIPPTEHQPGQFRTFMQTINVAERRVSHLSGMPTPANKNELLTRLGDLALACKVARQRANEEEVDRDNIGNVLTHFLNASGAL